MKFILLLAVILLLFSCKGKVELPETQAMETPDKVESVVEEPAAVITETADKAASTSKPAPATKVQPAAEPKTSAIPKESYKVTFMEIGSVSCIPCKMMQPIMKEIAEAYKGIVKVEFYDLGVDREIGPKYNIRVMPTQVFLDANGKEFFRHEGFYPKEELAKMLDAHLSKTTK
jgi:thioredoxin 1